MFDVIVIVFGVAMSLAPLLQIRRMLRMGHSDEVSIGMFVVLAVGASLWLGYGIEHNLVTIIVANAVGLVVFVAAIAVAAALRRRQHP